ncbi:MAG: DUF2130 domain-containing protein [Nitrosopumilus sp. (ex Thoosa mismalolli)]|nr:DUF2130 domain-containing protein [Nitrosopumilus sp. (ex Thoosa mismalolli)]
MEIKLKENYEEKHKESSKDFEKQIKELKRQHEEILKNQKTNFEEQSKALQKNLSDANSQAIDLVKKEYEKMSKDSKKNFDTLTKDLKKTHAKDIKEKERHLFEIKKRLERDSKNSLQEKTKQISVLKKQLTISKKLAKSEAQIGFDQQKDRLEQEIRERDIQLKRVGNEVEELKNRLSQNQSEIQGEAGEIDLYEKLTVVFPDDRFLRQKRGTESADIIQTIRTTSESLDTQIVYDNKESKTITKSDINKAKKYKKIHGTNYSIIVSANLPKKDVPNGFLGRKDGILLVHPSIVVEISKQIRSGIIEISKLSTSKEDKKEKESKLYDYITNQEFSMLLQSIYELHQKMCDVQNKEEKSHHTLWKQRKDLQDQLISAYTEISSSIDSITQKEVLVEAK